MAIDMNEQWVKFAFDIAGTAIGFLFALLVNSYNNRRLDKKTYKSMLMAIQNEAISNKSILKDSFDRYAGSGIVLRGFSVGTVERYLSEPLFVRYASSTILEELNSYLRNIKLANLYREKDEKIKLGEYKEAQEHWSDALIDVWLKHLDRCRESLDTVIYTND